MFFIFFFCLGAIFGSFLNACEWRLKNSISFLDRRSRCPACQKTLRWYHLVPLASYAWIDGRCAFCHKKISWQYPAVEAWMGAVFVFLVFSTVIWSQFLWYGAAAFVLTFIFIYDLKYQEIPDEVTVPAMAFFLVLTLLFYMHRPVNVLLGVGLGGGVFLLQYLVSRGRWIGGGDIRLGLLMGVILGWPGILVALFLAYVVGAGIAMILVLLKKKTMHSAVPFGAFLAPATLVAMIWGEGIIRWYVGLIQ